MLIIVMAGNYLNKILPPKRGPENIHEVNVGKQCHYVTWKAVSQIKTRRVRYNNDTSVSGGDILRGNR